MKMLPRMSAVAVTSLATATAALASESADTGVTEMNAGPGTFFLILGGVGVMGLAIWLLLKVMNRGK